MVNQTAQVYSQGTSGGQTPQLNPGEDPIRDTPGQGPGGGPGVDLKPDYRIGGQNNDEVYGSDGLYKGTWVDLVRRHTSGSLTGTTSGASAPGGGAGGSSGGIGPGVTTPLTQSLTGQTSSGSQGFSVGAGLTRNADSVRQGEFVGLDTAKPDEKISPFASPSSINWNDLEVAGSLCSRRGTLKCAMDIKTVTYAAAPLASTYQGSGLCPIPRTKQASGADGLLLTFSDASRVIGAAATMRAILVTQTPLWAKHRSLKDVNRWGTTTITPGSGQLAVATAWATTNVLDDVIAISVRYSTTGYPLDVDGKDDTGSSAFPSASRTAWTGTSVTKTATGLTAATLYYVTLWAIGRFGISQPYFLTGTPS